VFQVDGPRPKSCSALKDSGNQVRPPMTGEFGWKGGVIVRGKNGYLIAAFSDGNSEDDVKVSTAGGR
jgi:hypothetical protein